MRYLLIGNGDAGAGELEHSIAEADAIIQINRCAHFDATAGRETRYVFLVNTGEREVTNPNVERLLSLKDRPELEQSTIMLARNPSFYTAKKLALKAKGNWHGTHCQTSSEWKQLSGDYRIKKISFWETIQLDMFLVKSGMPPSHMPSTGMIAYNWLRRRLRKGDSLNIVGFTFHGWGLHPWEVEKTIVKRIDPHIAN